MTGWTPERRKRQSEIITEWHRKRREDGIGTMKGLKVVGMYLDNPSRKRLEALRERMEEPSRSAIVRRLIKEESERRRFGEVRTIVVPKAVFDWMVNSIDPLSWFGRQKIKLYKGINIKSFRVIPGRKRKKNV